MPAPSVAPAPSGPPSAGSLGVVAGAGSGGTVPPFPSAVLVERAVSAPGPVPAVTTAADITGAAARPAPLTTRSVSAALPPQAAPASAVARDLSDASGDDSSRQLSPPPATPTEQDADEIDAMFLGAAMRQPQSPDDPLHGLIEFQYLALPYTNAVYGSSVFVDSSQQERCVL